MNLVKEFLNLGKNDKIMLMLLFVFTGNIVIAVVKFIFSLILPSLWFFVNSAFLAVLSIARFFSIRDYGKIRSILDEKVKDKIECRNYLNNGKLLIVLGLIYFFVSVYVYIKGTNTTMHEYLTYLVALNAFWSIGWAIHGIFEYRKENNFILKSVKITNFANALTGIVLTQVVLLDTFGGEFDYSIINGYTGMFVSLLIILMGFYMVISIRFYLT